MTVLYQGRLALAFVLSEAAGYRSREEIVIPQSQDIAPGTIMGARVVVASATATAGATVGNTGNATIAMGAPPVTSKVKNGRYNGTALTATTVQWEDPDGIDVGISTHGAVFSKGGVKFTITAGGTPNVANDTFYIDVGVEPADFEFVPWTPTATDGTDVAACINGYHVVTAAGKTAETLAFVRDCEVNAKELVMPGSLTNAQIAKAYADLAESGIIVRN